MTETKARRFSLDTVRALQREYEDAKQSGRLDNRTTTVADYVAGKLGIGTRQAERYLLTLKASQAVQDAVDRGLLAVNNAAPIAHLDESTQAKIVEEIGAGKNVKEVLRKHLPKMSANANKAFAAMMACLATSIPMLHGRLGKITVCGGDDIAILDSAVAFFADLRQRMAAAHAEQQARQQRTATLLEQLGGNVDRDEAARVQQQADPADASEEESGGALPVASAATVELSGPFAQDGRDHVNQEEECVNGMNQ